MSSDNTNLEEMVEKTLETTGVLPKMRAELRANVFHVLEEGSSFQNKLHTDKIKEFISNKNGSLLLSLVKDLFEYLELTFTTSVFEPETGAGHQYQYKNKDDIFAEFSLSKNDKRPLLLQILDTYQSHTIGKSTDDAVKKSSTDNNSKTYEESSLAQILQNNAASTKTIFNCKSSLSPTKTKIYEEQNLQSDSHTNSNSLSSSNFNLSESNIILKETESSESLNSSPLEKLSPIKRPIIEQNDNTDEDIKSDLKSTKNESSLEDIETDENVSCGNNSLPSSDLSTQNSSPEILKTRKINL